MLALETRRPGDTPNPASRNPWHPETHHGLEDLDLLGLPLIAQGPLDRRWMPTGFIITGGREFVTQTMKERFFHNPAVGYAFREDGMVVEYEYQAQAV